MLFKKSDGVPKEISKVGLKEWYESLTDQNKVKLKRYTDGSDTSSKFSFLLSVMRKANSDENYSIAETVGELAIKEDLDPMQRFDVLEEMVIAYFGTAKYDRCLRCCECGLDLIPQIMSDIKKRNGGELPERINCRNYTINVLIGVRDDYDNADKALDRFYDMGLISEEDLEYRKQSHKIHRLQKTIDSVYSLKFKDE